MTTLETHTSAIQMVFLVFQFWTLSAHDRNQSNQKQKVHSDTDSTNPNFRTPYSSKQIPIVNPQYSFTLFYQ
jgi:hypothetical protein